MSVGVAVRHFLCCRLLPLLYGEPVTCILPVVLLNRYRQMGDPVVLQIDCTRGINAGVSISAVRRNVVAAAGATVVVSNESGAQLCTLRGHSGPISCLRVSRTGRLLATGQRAKASGKGAGGVLAGADVCVWGLDDVCGADPVADPAPLHTFEEYDGGVASLDFSDDDRLLIAAGVHTQDAITIWDLSTGGIVAKSSRLPDPVCAVRFGGWVLDMKRRATSLYQFITAGRGGLSVWALEPRTGRLGRDDVGPAGAPVRDYISAEVQAQQSPSAPNSMAHACLGTTSGDIVIVDITARAIRHVVSVAGGAVTSICLTCSTSSQPTLIAAGTADGSVVVLQLRNRESSSSNATTKPVLVQRAIRLDEGVVWSVSAFSSSSWLASTSSGALFEISSTPDPAVSETASLDMRSSATTRQAVGLASQLLYRGAGATWGGAGSSKCSGASPLALLAFSIPSIASTLIDSTSLGNVTAVATCPVDAGRFATASSDCVLRVWDTSTGNARVTDAIIAMGAGHPTCITFPTTEFHISGWRDGGIRAYRVADSGDEEPRTTTSTHGMLTTTTSSTSAGHARVPTAPRKEQHSERDALLWMIPGAHPPSVSAFGGAPTVGRVPAEDAGSAALSSAVIEGVTALVLTRNQRRLVSSGGNGVVRVWDVRTRELLCHFVEHAGIVTGLQLSPDDSTLLCVGSDRACVTLDLRLGRRVSRQIQRLYGLCGVTLCGERAVTASSDGRLALWETQAEEYGRGGVADGPLSVLGPGHAPAPATCVASANLHVVFASGGGDGRVLVWDGTSGLLLSAARVHAAASVNALAWTADDRQIISVGDDGVVAVINVYFPGE